MGDDDMMLDLARQAVEKATAAGAQGVWARAFRSRKVDFTGRDGALAEYLVLPVVNLHHVPDGLEPAAAVFAEPLAAAFEIGCQVPTRLARM